MKNKLTPVLLPTFYFVFSSVRLLTDGRVFSAGGLAGNPGELSNVSLTLFSDDTSECFFLATIVHTEE